MKNEKEIRDRIFKSILARIKRIWKNTKKNLNQERWKNE